MITTYVLDLNSGLTQVLGDGTTWYLYGNGRVGEYGTGWEYYLADALGSVRQLTDDISTVIMVQSYEPFGDVMESYGVGESSYGFTGEQTDVSGLQFLRARYMDTETGRFITRDGWQGISQGPISQNRFIYASANPVNLKDATGFYSELPGLVAFAWCFELHSLFEGSYNVNIGDATFTHNVSAQGAVDICRQAYSPGAWNFMSSTFSLDSPTPTTAHELFGWYLYEKGGRDQNYLQFDGNHPLTEELASSWWIHLLRWKYYLSGDVTERVLHKFNKPQFAASILIDSWNSVGDFSLPLSFVLGSFYYQIRTVNDGDRVGFRIDNDTTLESGTHIAGRFQPDFYGSIEALLLLDPSLQNAPLYEVIKRSNAISILSSRSREDPDLILGGGNMYQTFTWTEKRDPCNMLLPFPLVLINLDIQPWNDYESNTENVPQLEGWN